MMKVLCVLTHIDAWSIFLLVLFPAQRFLWKDEGKNLMQKSIISDSSFRWRLDHLPMKIFLSVSKLPCEFFFQHLQDPGTRNQS